MNFGTSAETNYDGFSIPSLEPGKHEVRLLKVEAGKSTKQDGSQGKNILTFLFETPQGQQHQHTEWEIDANANKAEEKAVNLTKRVGHIMSKYLPKDRLAQNNATFEAYANWVATTMNSVDYKSVPVEILVVGNVYQGKATTQLMGYPPFIARKGEPLNFDNNGLQSNRQYQTFMDNKTNARPDADGGQAGSTNSFGATAADAVKTDF